jgi:hypothetical protein
VSGTELGRLMQEVTERPPVDVDFRTVARLAARRRTRLVATVSGAAVVVATAIIVPLALAGHSSGDAQPSPPGRPASSPQVAVGAGWTTSAVDAVTWGTPPGWHVLRVKPVTHSTPAGASSTLARLSTVPLSTTCENPDSPCLLRLPSNQVLASIVVGGGSGIPSSSALDTGTLTKPDDECAALGGARSFTSERDLGSAPYTIHVQVLACLGKDAPAAAATQLRAVVASVTDSDAVTVDSSWKQITLGQLGLQLPPGWSVGTAQTADTILFNTSCLTNRQTATTWACTPRLSAFRADQGVVWVSAIAPPDSVESKVKYQGSMPATGSCAAAGGKYDYIDGQRHLGPQASGELITVSACMGSAVPNGAYQEITLMLNTMVDAQYPSAAQLCTAVPGAVSSALATVGDMRLLKWGTARPAMDIFPKAAAGDDSAWCWVRDDADKVFNVWAVHAGDAPVKVVDVGLPWFSWGTFAPSVAPVSLVASSFYTLGPSPTPAAAAAATPTLTPAAASGVAVGTTAAELCRSALGTYATADLTTVGDVRTATWGPGAGIAGAFPGAAASDPAAWCWQLHGGEAGVYAAHTGDPAVLAITISGAYKPGQVPSGPPNVP